MKSLFVNKNDTFTIQIFSFINKEKGEMYISDNKEKIIKTANVPEDLIQKDEVIFNFPSYGDNIAIYKDSVRIEGDKIHIDPIALRHNKFVTLLKDWTFKGENGEPLTVSDENIREMDPSLANLIIDELEKRVGIG